MIFMAEQETAVMEKAAEQTAAPAAEEQQKKAVRKKSPKPPAGDGAAATSMSNNNILLFNKYSWNVEILDPSLRNYLNLKPTVFPDSFRRTANKRFSKATINIVERLANDMMRGGTGGKVGGKIIRTKGRLQGKKFTVMKAIMQAFEVIQKQTGKNPVEVLVRALENSAPIEDTTRVRYGGIISNVPVDVSASRRLDIAIRNIAMATVVGAFGVKKSLKDALANELVMAARADVNSYAIKRKNEIERMARSAK